MHYYIPLSLQFHGRLPVCTLFSPNPEYLILIPKHQKEKKKRKEKCVQKYSTPILTHNLQNVVPQQAESISSPPQHFFSLCARASSYHFHISQKQPQLGRYIKVPLSPVLVQKRQKKRPLKPNPRNLLSFLLPHSR